MYTGVGDSRLVLLSMCADGVEVTGRVLFNLWQQHTRRGRFSQLLRDLESNALVGRVGEGPLHERVFRLTEGGHRVVWGELDPEVLWARPWDGRWRMAMFDVPQAHAKLRTSLRRKLRAVRFGWLQNSVWLSPDPVGELVRGLERQRVSVESLLFFEGRPTANESDEELVAGAWDFARLEKLHAAHLKLLKLRPTAGRSAKLADWSAWLETENRAWQEIARHDPFLPAALLPANYAGRSVWRARVEALRSTGRSLAHLTAPA